MEKGGQLVAGFDEDDDDELELAEAPTAIFCEMLGLFVVIKLPHICWNASSRSGPIFAAGGPKSNRFN